MRIQRLLLHNFFSFSDCDLDLSGVQHGVLSSGPTGSGKSAMIDGVLWALFGRSRIKRADGYIKIGKEDCQVSVEFALSGSIYRVVRSRSINTKAGKSDLQLTVSDGNGGWAPIGGKTIPETQGKIQALIGVPYETLITGNFALQGDSGKFTKAPVSERISVLSELLGLGVYQEWRESAGKEARALDLQATTLEAQVVEADGELTKRPGLEASLTASNVTQVASREMQSALATTIEQATQELATHRSSLDPLRRELAGFAETRQSHWTKNRSRAEKTARVANLTSLLSRRGEIEQAAAKVAEIDVFLGSQRQELASLEAEGKGVKAQVGTADESVANANLVLNAASDRLNLARARVFVRPEQEKRVARLGAARTEREDVEDLKASNESIASERGAELSRIMSANLEAQKKAGEIEAQARKVGADAKGLEPRIADFERRAEIMARVPCLSQAPLVATCPLLADARQASQDVAPLKAKHGTLCAWVRPTSPGQQDTAPIRKEILKIETAIAADRKTLFALDAEIAILQPAEAELASLETVQTTIPGLEADEATALQARDAAVLAEANLRASLDALKVRYITLQVEITGRESARSDLVPAYSLASDLAHAETDLPGLQADVATLTAEIHTLQASLDREAEVKTTISETEACITTLNGRLMVQREDLASYRQTELGAQQEAATLRAELSGLEKLATDREQAAAEAARIRGEHTILTALELAYRQCPLMILENEAIPEIEHAADAVLARISQSGIRVSLRTQRQIKARDALADGLDIIIRDQVGEREYEAYSGGQQFQIDLAIRVGLAKLQARRAGAVIETLIVDEGFGTQSAECLDGIVAALRAVQADFPLLWCISHVEALRDVFPAQIRVAGGPRDSVAELVMA